MVGRRLLAIAEGDRARQVSGLGGIRLGGWASFQGRDGGILGR
jgi:hypothetical protein